MNSQNKVLVTTHQSGVSLENTQKSKCIRAIQSLSAMWNYCTNKYKWIIPLITAFGRLMMAYDMFTDVLIVQQLARQREKHPNFFIASLVILFFQYFVIWVLLWRPVLKMKQDRNWSIFYLGFYLVLGVPALIFVDVAFFTLFLFTPGDKHQYLLYYERLRSVTESFTESLPEVIFQFYIGLNPEFDSIPKMVFATSITAALLASVKNVWQLKSSADKLGVDFREFVIQVTKAGVGAIPFKSIREGNIPEVRLLFRLSETETQKLIESVLSPQSVVTTI